MGLYVNNQKLPEIPLTRTINVEIMTINEDAVKYETKQQFGRYYQCPQCQGFHIFATDNYCSNCGTSIVFT